MSASADDLIDEAPDATLTGTFRLPPRRDRLSIEAYLRFLDEYWRLFPKPPPPPTVEYRNVRL